MARGEGGRPGGRKSSEQIEREAFEAARLRYEDGLSNDAIAASLGIKTDQVAGRVQRARAGLIALHVADPDTPAVDVALSARLENVARIRTVVAVRTTAIGSISAAMAAGDEAGTHPAPDRLVHQALAASAASHLWAKLRDGDRIAVGPGRAVRFTVDALARCAAKRPRTFSGLGIVSLTGNPPVRRDPHDLNSDAIAAALASVLGVVEVEQVNAPYIDEDPGRALRHVNSTWGPERSPEIALLGLGVLDANHHLMSSWRTAPQLARVRSILQRLEEDVFPASSSAIMDLYDTFWLRDGALEGRRAATARRLVEELNSKVVAVQRPTLDQAREKIVISGGRYKYDGTLAFLRQRDAIGVHPTVLVTDADTAQRLVEDLERNPLA